MKDFKLFLMFCGQGSQYIGMGKDFFANNKGYTAYLDECSHIIGEDISDIIYDRNEKGGLLKDTKYSQLAIYCLSSAIGDYIKTNLDLATTDVYAVLGHSLGDYSALSFCRSFDYKDGIKLVEKRGAMMSEENKSSQGMMAAVLGIEKDRLSLLLEKSGRPVYIANHNDYRQIVISGLKKDILYVIDFLKDNKVRKVIPLKVNIASHCPLMKDVSDGLYRYIEGSMDFNEPCFSFYSSTELKFLKKEDIALCLKDQLINPIRWVDSIQNLIGQRSIFVEIGPGNVLSRIVSSISKKIGLEDIKIFDTDNQDNIDNALEYIKEVKNR